MIVCLSITKDDDAMGQAGAANGASINNVTYRSKENPKKLLILMEKYDEKSNSNKVKLQNVFYGRVPPILGEDRTMPKIRHGQALWKLKSGISIMACAGLTAVPRQYSTEAQSDIDYHFYALKGIIRLVQWKLDIMQPIG